MRDILSDLPEVLKLRVQEALDSLACWYEAWGGRVAISFSGGKDSTVLVFLAEYLYPGLILKFFVNTGIEYPEIVRFVRSHSGVIEVRPKKCFRWVVENKGYPLVSKIVAKGIRTLRNPSDRNLRLRNLLLTGVNSSGNSCKTFKIAKRWLPLVGADFNTSEKCCDVLKKEPLERLKRQTGRMPIIGIMQDDSQSRKMGMAQTGCNIYDSKHPISRPLKNWTEQNVLEFIHLKNIPISSIYGEVIRDPETGLYQTTGEDRTGCMFCGFGVHMEGSPNRFQRMRVTHPVHYSVGMDKLGMRKPLQFIGVPI